MSSDAPTWHSVRTPSTPAPRVPAVAKRVAALGPAFVAAIAYVDPGNIATNTEAGSSYGFLLLWVVVLATLMAGPVQYLSAKLGVVTGMSLPQHVAARHKMPTRVAYWIQAELVAIATDVAEIIGAAVALHLLFGLPLVASGLLTALVSVVMLAARERWGAKAFEVFSGVALVAIGAGFAVGVLAEPGRLGGFASGLVPAFDGQETVLLAAGIVGATVMPHAIYLHSALTSGQSALRDPRTSLRWTRFDVTAAMLVAGSINVAMLVLGATALHGGHAGSLESSVSHLATQAGHGAEVAFLVALLVSGLSSTAVGTQAGAVIMSGLVQRRLPTLVRRGVTLIPALALLASGLEPMRVLVLSQVALSLGLPFALIPLLRLTSGSAMPEGWRNGRVLTLVVAAISAVVIVLDLALIVLTVTG